MCVDACPISILLTCGTYDFDISSCLESINKQRLQFYIIFDSVATQIIEFVSFDIESMRILCESSHGGKMIHLNEINDSSVKNETSGLKDFFIKSPIIKHSKLSIMRYIDEDILNSYELSCSLEHLIVQRLKEGFSLKFSQDDRHHTYLSQESDLKSITSLSKEVFLTFSKCISKTNDLCYEINYRRDEYRVNNKQHIDRTRGNELENSSRELRWIRGRFSIVIKVCNKYFHKAQSNHCNQPSNSMQLTSRIMEMDRIICDAFNLYNSIPSLLMSATDGLNKVTPSIAKNSEKRYENIIQRLTAKIDALEMLSHLDSVQQAKICLKPYSENSINSHLSIVHLSNVSVSDDLLKQFEIRLGKLLYESEVFRITDSKWIICIDNSYFFEDDAVNLNSSEKEILNRRSLTSIKSSSNLLGKRNSKSYSTSRYQNTMLDDVNTDIEYAVIIINICMQSLPFVQLSVSKLVRAAGFLSSKISSVLVLFYDVCKEFGYCPQLYTPNLQNLILSDSNSNIRIAINCLQSTELKLDVRLLQNVNKDMLVYSFMEEISNLRLQVSGFGCLNFYQKDLKKITYFVLSDDSSMFLQFCVSINETNVLLKYYLFQGCSSNLPVNINSHDLSQLNYRLDCKTIRLYEILYNICTKSTTILHEETLIFLKSFSQKFKLDFPMFDEYSRNINDQYLSQIKENIANIKNYSCFCYTKNNHQEEVFIYNLQSEMFYALIEINSEPADALTKLMRRLSINVNYFSFPILNHSYFVSEDNFPKNEHKNFQIGSKLVNQIHADHLIEVLRNLCNHSFCNILHQSLLISLAEISPADIDIALNFCESRQFYKISISNLCRKFYMALTSSRDNGTDDAENVKELSKSINLMFNSTVGNYLVGVSSSTLFSCQFPRSFTLSDSLASADTVAFCYMHLLSNVSEDVQDLNSDLSSFPQINLPTTFNIASDIIDICKTFGKSVEFIEIFVNVEYIFHSKMTSINEDDSKFDIENYFQVKDANYPTSELKLFDLIKESLKYFSSLATLEVLHDIPFPLQSQSNSIGIITDAFKNLNNVVESSVDLEVLLPLPTLSQSYNDSDNRRRSLSQLAVHDNFVLARLEKELLHSLKIHKLGTVIFICLLKIF